MLNALAMSCEMDHADAQKGGPKVNRRALVMLAALPFVARSTAGRAAAMSDVRFFDQQFRSFVSDPDRILTEPRIPIEIPNVGSVRSCGGLLENNRLAREAAGATEDRRFAAYQICYAVAALRRARTPTKEVSQCYMEPDACVPAAIIRERLDLRSFPNSFSGQAADRNEPTYFASLGQETRVVSRFSLVAEVPDWIFQIDALATADFDGQGDEQWLVHIIDRATVAGYFSTGYLILNGIGGSGPVTGRWLGRPHAP